MKNIRLRCTEFLLVLIDQLRLRLPDNYSILQGMTELSISCCMNPVKKDIIPLANLFISEAGILTKIDFQWRQLHTVPWKILTNNEQTTVQFWAEVNNYTDSAGDNPFEDLAKFALMILSLPHSNADVERAFSQVNIIKNKLRNRMKVFTLNNILTIKYGLKRLGKCCHEYDLPTQVLKKIGTCESYSIENDGQEEKDILNLFKEEDK